MMWSRIIGALLLLEVSGISRAFLLDDNSLQDLISLISQEKKMRADVEKELETLQQDIQQMKNGQSSCK